MGVDELLDFPFVFLEIDDLGIASPHGGIELHEKFQVVFIPGDLLCRRLLKEAHRRQRGRQRPGVDRQPLLERGPQGLISQEPFIFLCVALVLDPVEQLPQIRMALRQLVGLFTHVGQRGTEVVQPFLVELSQRAVDVERLVEILQHPAIVDDVAEILAVVEAVHARDGLQQAVPLEHFGEIQHRVARRIESGQQHVNDDNDFRLVRMLKGVNELPLVLPLAAEAGHHLFPKGLHGLRVIALDLYIALPVIRW